MPPATPATNANDSSRAFPSRSSSLTRGARRHDTSNSSVELQNYPGVQLHDPRYYPTEDDPLTADASPRIPQQSPQQGSPRGVGALPYYEKEKDALGPQQPYAFSSDQPYAPQGHQGHGGSLDLSDPYAGTDEHDRSAMRSDSTHNSRTALPLGAKIHVNPNESTPSVRYADQTGTNEKSGYRSPRGRSRENLGGYRSPRAASQDGLGNWTGPARGASPYGPLGEGPGANQRSGLTSAASSNPNLLFADGEFSLWVVWKHEGADALV